MLGNDNKCGDDDEETKIDIDEIEDVTDILSKKGTGASTPTEMTSVQLENKVAASVGVEDRLWVDKYQPQTVKDLIGNEETIKEFQVWLNDWHDVCINGRKKKQNPPKRGQSWANLPNINARACMVSGPPGIGKSSMVRIIAESCGFGMMEINASDKKSKGVIESMIKELCESSTMDWFFKKSVEQRKAATENRKAKEINKKTIIVMDEVDGCGSSDRGGIAALIKVIKVTRTPIVCISNDHSSRKIVSLMNHCLDLRFTKPKPNDIVKRISTIAKAENLRIELTGLERIIEFSNNDIRAIINLLQLWKTTDRSIKTDMVRIKEKQISKDQKNFFNSFQAIQKLLNVKENRAMNFKRKMELFFIDYSLMPLLCYENYITTFANGQESLQDLERAAMCSDMFSHADQINELIFNGSTQNWGLLAELGLCGVVAPSNIMKGFLPYTKFPEVMGKLSSQRKSNRMIKELV